MNKIFAEAFAFVLFGIIDLVLDFLEFTDRLAKQNRERWANLTRPLLPTEAEKFAANQAEAQRIAIGLSNREIQAKYNHKTWWNEYHWLRTMNVN